jgi:predicted  nucleic acid-binding Zn-ribbon protein
LRYEEFISLNTWQIQKLKPRMTAAEEKIQQLEEEISQLKTEISTLKQQ